MAAPRRVGSEKSETRDRLLDGVERLMLEEGYAAVTYRAVATRAGVTPGLVQYYFPTLGDLFVASIRRYTARNVEHLVALLETHADQPQRALWSYSRDEASAALVMEYMALGNHRRSIRSELAKVTKRVQRIQLDALTKRPTRGKSRAAELPPAALMFFLTGLPKLIQLYEGLGLSTGHQEIVELFERYLDAVEPRSERRRSKPRTSRSRRRS
jgi:TetR/AcrR family transcriptional regulator, transcriptional repressor for nem operon